MSPNAVVNDTDSSRSPGVTLRWLTIGLLFFMLLALVGVVVVLPDLVADRVTEEQKPAAETPRATLAPSPPSADARRLAKEKREAEKQLGIVLRKQTELEAEGVSIWGGQDYDAALDTLATGDAELQAGQYAQAANTYGKVGVQLDALFLCQSSRWTRIKSSPRPRE